MDLNKIHYFFAAAEHQNFTKAADQCHIAQTTMSKYITVLEQELGCRLFARTHKAARLTEQGQLFYDTMKKISQEYQDLCRELNRNTDRELRIGMLTTDYEDFPALHSFELSHPEISVYYSFGEPERVLSELDQHRLDALICPNILLMDEHQKEAIVRLDLVSIEESLFCSQELMDRYGSMAEVIAHQPLITKAAETGYHEFCRRQLLAVYGKTFSDVQVVSSFPQQLLLLNLSRGFAIMPSTVGSEYGNLISVPTSEEFFETAQLLYRKDSVSPGLKMLLDHILS